MNTLNVGFPSDMRLFNEKPTKLVLKGNTRSEYNECLLECLLKYEVAASTHVTNVFSSVNNFYLFMLAELTTH